MGKLFKLALEEAVETQPEVVQDIPVDELVNNAEELAKTDAEIQQDVQAVEDLMEEKAVLEEQVEKNEELLSNPDAVVSTVDVEVSEECRDKVHYFLGYDSSIGKIRLSSESMYDDVKSNPRKYLAISNEDIKETIKKIWEKIKAFFKKIWDNINLKARYVKNKLSGIFGKTKTPPQKNYTDFIPELSKFLKESWCPLLVDLASQNKDIFSFLDLDSFLKHTENIKRIIRDGVSTLKNSYTKNSEGRPIINTDALLKIISELRNEKSNLVLFTYPYNDTFDYTGSGVWGSKKDDHKLRDELKHEHELYIHDFTGSDFDAVGSVCLNDNYVSYRAIPNSSFITDDKCEKAIKYLMDNHSRYVKELEKYIDKIVPITEKLRSEYRSIADLTDDIYDIADNFQWDRNDI